MQKHQKKAFILRDPKIHKRLIIKPIVKRFGVKKGIYTEGYPILNSLLHDCPNHTTALK
jgi:hypothetical protein